LACLEELELTGSSVGDDGLRGLKHNNTIRVLHVGRTPIGDRDVETLLTMLKLKTVSVDHAGITDQELMRLATHTALRQLHVGSDVPESTVNALRQHLKCDILR
jgi:hypothetical protein